MASYWVVEMVDPMASPWMVEVTTSGTAGSAASYRMFAARWEAVLGHRQRSTSDEQRSDNREIFQYGHHVLQKAHATHPDEQLKVPRKACCFDLDQYPALKGERASILNRPGRREASLRHGQLFQQPRKKLRHTRHATRAENAISL
jgi:hypothetical protein